MVATTREEAMQAVRDSMEHSVFGQAGQRVLIEQFLDGEELTIMAFTDGRTVVPMLPAQDHKRVGDGDAGPNTGGMGAYCPAPLGTKALREQVTRQVLYPAVEALSRMGCPVSRRPVCRAHGCERDAVRLGVQCPGWEIRKRRSSFRCSRPICWR